MKKVLFIIGSIRKNSFNRRLAEYVAEMLSGKAELSFLEYGQIPFMNQDIEFPPPESVRQLRGEIMAADGIWIFTPEYNYQVPGVLKNLLDWLSRPLSPDDRRATAVSGKPVTISGAAGKSGAAGARGQLEKLLEIMSMRVIGGKGSGIVLGAEAFTEGKFDLSDKDKRALSAQLELFIAEI